MSDIALHIYGQKFVFWEGVTISRAVDTVSTATFSAPFEHDAPGFKENFNPFGFAPVLIEVDNDPLFTGTMLSPRPRIEEDRKLDVSCYATCGVLMDCTAPADALPLEFNNLTLKEISERLAGYLNIEVNFQGDPGAKFGRVACDPDKRIFEFLTDLAKQRGFVLSSDVEGKLLIWKSVDSEPVAVLEQGVSPLLSVSADFRPQEYYSDITGLTPIAVARPAAKRTVGPKKKKERRKRRTKAEIAAAKAAGEDKKTPAPKAPTVRKPKPPKHYSKFTVHDESHVFRPFNFKIEDIEGVDIATATDAKLARMLANIASYSIEVNTWRDSSGKLWEPNSKIRLKAPDAMIYDFYVFDIRSVTYRRDEDSETAVIELTLPGAFSGDAPEIYPWEL